ncbi:FadR/GntR family transcriptional regulator [Roseomonas elaeocarpi]|uniref:FadR/GntR family transcriptional regulator n=1 Tax=Roseomonas elaeocarpi TaxID=907779 RepID=A0ABV6JLR6_9PROT
MSSRPKPLDRPRLLHITVQESLKAFITDNRLAAGDPLPPEGALARALQVSRSSVREAVRALESLGIIESRRGVGVFVSAFSFAPLLDNLAFGLRDSLCELKELLEIRRALEVATIGDAMRAMSVDDKAELRRIVDAMHDRAEHAEDFAAEDQEFHRVLFRSGGNVTLGRLLDVFWVAFARASADLKLHNTAPLATWQDHKAIAEAVTAGEVETARIRLHEHYESILTLIAERMARRTS